MDDLSSLDWSTKAASAAQQNRSTPFNTSAFRATPIPPSLTPQPLSRPSSTLNSAPKLPVKSISPANDSFSTLLSLNSGKSQTNLSLQERQKQLLEEKRRQQEEQRQRHDHESQFWDTVGSKGRSTPAVSSLGNNRAGTEDEDDILAAFDANVKVDRSSHFPPPSAEPSGRNTPSFQAGNGLAQSAVAFGDDDDPFGLGSPPSKATTTAPLPAIDDTDDDFLGDLSKPVTAKAQSTSNTNGARSTGLRETSPPPAASADPLDRGIAELIDMGFPADKAQTALQETDGSTQAAVGWLLNQAHEQSRQRSRGGELSERVRSPAKTGHQQGSSRNRSQLASGEALPAWLRQESRPSSAGPRQDSRSPAGDRDVSQFATEIGSTLFKSANSLWKTGQKKVQKAVAEFQQEGGDSSQPKWMRDASTDSQHMPGDPSRTRPTRERIQTPSNKAAVEVTDEAMLLEAGDSHPRRAMPKPAALTDRQNMAAEGPPSRGRSPAHDLPQRPASQPRPAPAPVHQVRQPTKLSRQAVEEEASQAYVSASRRRRPAPKVEPEPTVDLFSPPSQAELAARAPSQPLQSARPTASSRPTPSPAPRPKAAPRNVPQISPSALATSSQSRKAGTEAFKRGDYAAAHEAYTAALRPLPETHPIIIIVLTNHALTAIKIGEPKTAVSDADKAIAIIGPAKGEGESIDIGGGEGTKDMKEFYGKALMRKAEALEHMEKWSDAAQVWRDAIAAGVGGAVGLQGRTRCEKAAGGAQAKAAPTTRSVASAPRRPAVRKLVASPAASAEAVKKLRAANAEAEKADDEKFQLSDAVSARIEAWKGGKSDNLRALLGSLDTVLWPQAGWKKVGMSDLVMPNKVKIIYMKAIAKVHPDKVSNARESNA